MEREIKAAQTVEDVVHKGVIIGLEPVQRGEKKFEYMDVTIEFEDPYGDKVSVKVETVRNVFFELNIALGVAAYACLTPEQAVHLGTVLIQAGEETE